MRKIAWLIILSVVFLMGCSKKVSVAEFSGIYPGMPCSELETYLGENNIPFKKRGNNYEFVLEENIWESAAVTCDGEVKAMEFDSTVGTSPRHGQSYVDVQQALLDTFRNNLISYEEGNRVINLNNGIRLHQFTNPKYGIITHFKISVESGGESKLAWEKAAPLLPEISSRK